MKNLAGVEEADQYIQEELYLAGIKLVRGKQSRGEIPCSIIGKLNNWKFERAWNYWTTSAQNGDGLSLEVATQMHKKKYPIIGERQPRNYGKVIRVAGHCGCPHPRRWANYYDGLGKLLLYDPKGQNERYVKGALSKGIYPQEQADTYHFVCTIRKLKELTSHSFVDSYHIDNQIGLNEFARVLRKL